MSIITFHKANQNDILILVDNRMCFALELAGHQPDSSIESLKVQMTNYFSKATGKGTCISVIARFGEQVAGIGSLHVREVPGNFKNPSGKWGYIMNMYTVPEFRRKGVCKGILNVLIDEGRQMGIGAFELHATNEGEFIYGQNGFEIRNEPTYRKYTMDLI